MKNLQLALDTSTSRPVAAVLRGPQVLHEWSGPSGTLHSETLLAGVHECLTRAKTNLRDVEFVSVGVGPGLFTGLRVGVTTAKFLADQFGWRVAPVSSLVALALGSRTDSFERLWALSDAKSQRVYALCVEPAAIQPGLRPRENEEVALPPEEAARLMGEGDKLIGEGALAFRNCWPRGTRVGESEEHLLHARNVGLVGLALRDCGALIAASELLPKYLKTGQPHL